MLSFKLAALLLPLLSSSVYAATLNRMACPLSTQKPQSFAYRSLEPCQLQTDCAECDPHELRQLFCQSECNRCIGRDDKLHED